mgnify:CR=1 FL=1
MRKHPRIEVPEHVTVKDANSGELLGQLVNLSVDGLMLMGQVCIAPGTVRQLRIPLGRGDAVCELTVGAESLWCHDANDSGAHWSGFQIIDISPEQQEILDAMVSE